jgi:hypothetical protein
MAMAIGARFAKWGLGIFGMFLTFGVVANYCVGVSSARRDAPL